MFSYTDCYSATYLASGNVTPPDEESLNSVHFIGLDLIAAVNSFVLQTLQIMKYLLSVVDFEQVSFSQSGVKSNDLLLFSSEWFTDRAK